MGLDISTEINVLIATEGRTPASWIKTGCTGVAFSEFGIFANNVVDGKGKLDE